MALIVVLDDSDALRYVSGLGRLRWIAAPVAEAACRKIVRKFLRDRLRQ